MEDKDLCFSQSKWYSSLFLYILVKVNGIRHYSFIDLINSFASLIIILNIFRRYLKKDEIRVYKLAVVKKNYVEAYFDFVNL